jgi:hypothetical protein
MTTTLIIVLNHSMIRARASAHVTPILAKDTGTATVVVAQIRQHWERYTSRGSWVGHMNAISAAAHRAHECPQRSGAETPRQGRQDPYTEEHICQEPGTEEHQVVAWTSSLAALRPRFELREACWFSAS